MPCPEDNIICINGEYIKAVRHNGEKNIFQLYHHKQLLFESDSCFEMIDYWDKHKKGEIK